MALPSARQDSKVNPEDGIYVEMERIMEVRYESEDIDYQREAEDMFEFQKHTQYIPDDFCKKNRSTTEQAYFFCLVCNCELKSLLPLRAHVRGEKHIRKATEYKRKVMGLEKDPQNAPRKKEIKKQRPKVDVGKTLEELLKDCGEPAVGLQFITEFTNPDNWRDHPMYTCYLDGCKKAWGTSDDMFNHVKNHKHQKNFFRNLHPEDGRILGMTKDELLRKSAEYEEDEGGADERNYGVIKKVRVLEEYMELRDRPDNWSEKKAKLGIVGDRCNSNMEPLGSSRKRKHSESGNGNPSQFDKDSWSGWKPPTAKESLQDLEKSFTRGITDIGEMIVDFKGKKDDDEYKEILFYQDTCTKLLQLFKGDEDVVKEVPDFGQKIAGWEEQFSVLNNNLVEKVEVEDRSMKEVSKLMSELEEELQQFYSQKTTKKYKNIRERIKELTIKVGHLNPTTEANKNLKRSHQDRLANVWKDFEDRSESFVEVLEKQMDAPATVRPPSELTSSQRSLQLRKSSIEEYKETLLKFVVGYLGTYSSKFVNEDERKALSLKCVEQKFLQPEVNNFTKRLNKGSAQSWAEFKLSEATKDNVKKYLVQKMERYKPGDVYHAK